MDIYSHIPALALGWYVLLMFSLMMTKTSKLKRTFLTALSTYVIWTLGSVGMRFGFGPSVDFWFHLSLFGLSMIPSATLFFMEQYMDGKNRKFSLLLIGISVALYLMNLVTNGCFIAAPRVVETEKGIRFVYENIDAWAAVPYVTYCVLMFYFAVILVMGVRRGKLERREFLLILTGKLLLFLGNLLILLQVFEGFPIDMAAGIPDAITTFFVLIMNEKIRTNRKIARKNYTLLAVILAYSISFLMAKPYENFLRYSLGERGEDNIMFLLVIVVLITFTLVYIVGRKMIGQLFFKEDELQLSMLNEFREKSHQTLDVKKIEELLENTIKGWLEAEWSRLCIYDSDSGTYCAAKPLPDGTILKIPKDSPMIWCLNSSNRCADLEALYTKDSGNKEYQEQLSVLKNERAELLQPIYSGKRLHALLVVSKGRHKYHASAKRCLELLAEVCPDALRNAELFAKVYWESRTDALTGVGNRTYFFENFSALKEAQAKMPISLMLVKIDDFRVCNQLYGVNGGDHFLKLLAEIIGQIVPGERTIFRYGSTEFMILLRECEEERAKELAEEIRLAMMRVSDTPERKLMITVSAGVCTAEKGMPVDTKLVDNCALALYMAQKAGKNCTIVYHEDADQKALSLENGLFKEYEAVFRALTAAVDAKDHYTASHSQNVSYYAMELARGVGLSPDKVEIVKEAGLLHDIGKIGIPESILMKPDRLTLEEYTIMKSHVEQAASILHHLSGMEYILPAVLGHHERYDGKGYPSGIAGEDIPILARVLGVVDAFDAMVSRRPYKQQFPLEFALNQLLDGVGTQFDPYLAPKFVELIREGKIQVRRGKEEKQEEWEENASCS